METSQKERPKETDEELIEQLRLGDGEALDMLLIRYKSIVKNKAQRYYLIGGDRDDLLQEGMIGLYKAICDYRPEGGARFRTFAELCIDRQLASAIKAAARKKHGPLNDYVSLERPMAEQESTLPLMDLLNDEGQEDPAVLLAERESNQMLQSALENELSSFEKDVLKDYLRGKDYQEIAARLKKPAKSIDNALQRIKQKARGVAQQMTLHEEGSAD